MFKKNEIVTNKNIVLNKNNLLENISKINKIKLKENQFLSYVNSNKVNFYLEKYNLKKNKIVLEKCQKNLLKRKYTVILKLLESRRWKVKKRLQKILREKFRMKWYKKKIYKEKMRAEKINRKKKEFNSKYRKEKNSKHSIKSKFQSESLISKSIQSIYKFNSILTLSNSIFLNFKKNNYNSKKFVSNILKSFFLKFHCLISKPIYIIDSKKIVILLFFYYNKSYSYKFKWLANKFTNKNIINVNTDIFSNDNSYFDSNELNKYNIKNLDFKNKNSQYLNLNNLALGFNDENMFNNWNFKEKEKNELLYQSHSQSPIKLIEGGTKFQNNSFFSLVQNSKHFGILGYIFNKIFDKNVELKLIRLHYPYHDSNILAQIFAFNSFKFKFHWMMRKLNHKIKIQDLEKLKNGSLYNYFLFGIKKNIIQNFIFNKINKFNNFLPNKIWTNSNSFFENKKIYINNFYSKDIYTNKIIIKNQEKKKIKSSKFKKDRNKKKNIKQNNIQQNSLEKLNKVITNFNFKKLGLNKLMIPNYKNNFTEIKKKLILENEILKSKLEAGKKKINVNNYYFLSSYLSGIKIRKAGRLFREPVIPRKTSKTMQMGKLSQNKFKIIETSRFTGKTKRGAFSLTVSVGHIF